MKYFELLVRIVIGTIVDWWQRHRLRRRLRKALGREVYEMELTSLQIWMEVPRNARHR